MRLRSVTLAFCCLFTASAFADVVTVDDDGPADFSDLQLAIDAAGPGDTLLLEPGSYSGASGNRIEIRDKGITILATGDERPLLVGGLSIVRVPLGQRCAVRGVEVTPTGGLGSRVLDSPGPVWIEDSVFESGLGGAFGLTGSLLTVADSDDVVLVDCTLSTSPMSSEPGEAGCLDVDSSSVFLFDSTLTAGATSVEGGAPTVQASQSTIIAQGGSIVGAPAAPSVFTTCPATAGAAIELLDQVSRVTAYGTTVEGGPVESAVLCPDSVPGPALIGGGTLEVFEVPGPRALAVPAVVTANAPFEVRITGEPGEAVGVAVFQTNGGLEFPGGLGSLVAPPGSAPIGLGLIGDNGELVVSLTPTGLPAGSPGLRFFAQGLLLTNLGGARLTSPTHALLKGAD